MTSPEQRFCPRCGTALVAGLRFCPGCGSNTADAGTPSGTPGSPGEPPVDALGRSLDGAQSATTPRTAPAAGDPRLTSPAHPVGVRQFADRVSPGIAIVFSALVITAGLVIFDVVTRPQPAGGDTSPQDGSAVVPSAPIVGLSIVSPRDGDAVATKEVTVIGLAPPGLTVTRDVSLGLDQHAAVDGTGHWAINVGLNEGQNDLVFRIGDDRSTEQRIRVIYQPQAP